MHIKWPHHLNCDFISNTSIPCIWVRRSTYVFGTWYSQVILRMVRRHVFWCFCNTHTMFLKHTEGLVGQWLYRRLRFQLQIMWFPNTLIECTEVWRCFGNKGWNLRVEAVLIRDFTTKISEVFYLFQSFFRRYVEWIIGVSPGSWAMIWVLDTLIVNPNFLQETWSRHHQHTRRRKCKIDNIDFLTETSRDQTYLYQFSRIPE